MLVDHTQTDTVTLTPAAAQAVKELLTKRNLQDQGYALRVFISGGGCSGLQYGMALDNKPRELDSRTECDGVVVIVDEMSIEYLRGATIDYIENPTGSGFKIDNPNQLSSCGCSSAASQNGAGCSGCH